MTGGKTVSEQKLVAAQRALEKAKTELAKQPDSTYAASTVDNAEQALLFAQFTHEQYVALQNGGVVRATCAGNHRFLRPCCGENVRRRNERAGTRAGHGAA